MAGVCVGVVMGSESDRGVMEKALCVLDELGVQYEVVVSSAHRNPEKTAKYAQEAAGRGVKVVIAGAGLAAALPGVLAAHTILPVIGVPIASGALNGMDALVSMAQMPSGVPVGTVGINNAKNAAFLAVEILALGDEEVRGRLVAFREKMSQG
ncbi:MAG: 5-(carboxyamino)imidazole ribonucleotide mutase [Candidatus Latescibacterota bacterium]